MALYREIAAAGPRRPSGPTLIPPLHFLSEVPRRRRFLQRYGWGVPTEAAIAAVTEFAAGELVLEVGAGAGLWAFLLSSAGARVVATDDFSWREASGPSGFAIPFGRFYPVEQENAVAAVQKHAGAATLLIVWPPPDRPMAYEALAAFHGSRLVYAGDPNASGDDRFHAVLRDNWRLSRRVPLPNWPGIHDAVFLYEHRTENWAPVSDRRPNPHLASRDFSG